MILNRPKKLNAFSLPMIKMMSSYFKEWENAQDVELIILKGRGRALGTGADIKALTDAINDPSRRHELDSFIEVAYSAFHAFEAAKTPVVTLMDGLAVGGAFSFSILSRFNVATENTKIMMPETRFGHFCDVGANFYLPRLKGNIGKYIALTAQMIHAEDALHFGLASHFVPADRLDYVEDCLINLDRPSVENIRAAIDRFSIKLDDVNTNKLMHDKNQSIINSCFRFNTVAEILEALQNEGSKFSLDTVDQICQGSPISTALTLEQMRKGSKMTYSECLQMEHKSWKITPYEPDFNEGVVATMIEKRKPQWSRKSHLDVDFEKDIVAKFFGNETK
ncbi:ClpP/crotonase-like domain-containing protein [Helicostylum pulchrum]|nr:ClpP/crotonase-like domain-containing protein [Helicostylum pulchrum]